MYIEAHEKAFKGPLRLRASPIKPCKILHKHLGLIVNVPRGTMILGKVAYGRRPCLNLKQSNKLKTQTL
jgi:hypothetical protein